MKKMINHLIDFSVYSIVFLACLSLAILLGIIIAVSLGLTNYWSLIIVLPLILIVISWKNIEPDEAAAITILNYDAIIVESGVTLVIPGIMQVYVEKTENLLITTDANWVNLTTANERTCDWTKFYDLLQKEGQTDGKSLKDWQDRAREDSNHKQITLKPEIAALFKILPENLFSYIKNVPGSTPAERQESFKKIIETEMKNVINTLFKTFTYFQLQKLTQGQGLDNLLKEALDEKVQGGKRKDEKANLGYECVSVTINKLNASKEVTSALEKIKTTKDEEEARKIAADARKYEITTEGKATAESKKALNEVETENIKKLAENEAETTLKIGKATAEVTKLKEIAKAVGTDALVSKILKRLTDAQIQNISSEDILQYLGDANLAETANHTFFNGRKGSGNQNGMDPMAQYALMNALKQTIEELSQSVKNQKGGQ